MALVDTHAHLHFDTYNGLVDDVHKRAEEAGVTKIITVGVDVADSIKAIELAVQKDDIYASAGIHPHVADAAEDDFAQLADLLLKEKVVAVGECGFDFFKSKTSKEQQESALRRQLDLAEKLDLPVIFHIREAFTEFLRVISDYPKVQGVVHSFSAGPHEAEQVLSRGLMVALNGIMTFTKAPQQLEAAKLIPADKLLLETDCPFLSPAPERGRTNEPAKVKIVAEFLAELRNESYMKLSDATTVNAEKLFRL
jgi:TatD DNase family protein